jgi:hypothetical protein
VYGKLVNKGLSQESFLENNFRGTLSFTDFLQKIENYAIGFIWV